MTSFFNNMLYSPDNEISKQALVRYSNFDRFNDFHWTDMNREIDVIDIVLTDNGHDESFTLDCHLMHPDLNGSNHHVFFEFDDDVPEEMKEDLFITWGWRGGPQTKPIEINQHKQPFQADIAIWEGMYVWVRISDKEGKIFYSNTVRNMHYMFEDLGRFSTYGHHSWIITIKLKNGSNGDKPPVDPPTDKVLVVPLVDPFTDLNMVTELIDKGYNVELAYVATKD